MRWLTLFIVIGLLAYSSAAEQDFDEDEGVVTEEVEVMTHFILIN